MLSGRRSRLIKRAHGKTYSVLSTALHAPPCCFIIIASKQLNTKQTTKVLSFKLVIEKNSLSVCNNSDH